MAYKALYREWRPKSFREVIGQDHVSITLQNAVSSGRIAHAYLFSGPRGTGKTSSAKVLAKALNCKSGPTAEPCNRCDACVAITNGNSLDVIEIDAASNRGIDEIRDLRERVKFAPSENRYKVYIIDEVHMLTTEAFNALLKTLEEPPSQVIFVLATTEPHKIPATILSRVQRFDFKRIGVSDIVQRLKDVMAELGGEADEDALFLIGRKAEGGMRDAISLLDQCYQVGARLDTGRVVDVLGSLAEEEVFSLAAKLLTSDVTGIMAQLDSLMLKGKEPGQVLKELTEHLRNLLILNTAPDALSLIPVSREFLPKVKEQSTGVPAERLVELISLLIKTDGELRFSSQPRITLEVALISLCAVKQAPLPEKRERQAAIPEAGKAAMKPRPEPVTETVPETVGDKQGASESKPAGLNLEVVRAEWKKVMALVRKASIGIHALLIEGSPSSLAGNLLTISFKAKNSFHRDKVEQPENKKIVEQALFSALGYPLGIKCEIDGEATRHTEPDDDIVNQTYEIFGQELVEIKD